jgi:hypothetical protein
MKTSTALAALGLVPSLLGACGGSNASPTHRTVGQSDFISAPQLGQTYGGGGGAFGTPNASMGGGAADNAGAAPSAPTTGGSKSSGSGSFGTPQVQETDLYAVEGNRLYYIDSYRGLMVFDLTNPRSPTFLGRAPIFGDPQEMTVKNGICVVVVGDWYGANLDGSPFHGSIARGFDATDPTSIKVIGDAKLGGYVQDTRIVGSVLYAVIQDYGWEYGWYGGWYGYYGGYGMGGGVAVPAGNGGGGYYGGSTQPAVAIASVNFANGQVSEVSYQKFAGTGGVFNVTPYSIVVATDSSAQQYNAPGQTTLQYVDISDQGGNIKLRGSITVNGAVTGWGADNGRWNLDFADGAHAHALGCSTAYCDSSNESYILSTVDFSNADAPVLSSTLSIDNLGWSPAALFNGSALYLSPSNYYYGYGPNTTTPLSVYDLTTPASPKLAGQTNLTGDIWLFRPDGTNLFSIGSTNSNDSTQVEVQYLNVADAASPKVLATNTFGSGWAWSPAASTFKAVTIDDHQGLMVVPFSGWDYNAYQYTNGVQLLQYTPAGITSSATAFSKGWVQRGIFVNGMLYSISDESLAVVDYTNPAAPKVTSELTLARNVVNAQPQGLTIAELSSDWWGNDTTTSEMRVLPLANASETTDMGTAASTTIPGVGAQIFQNGTLAYVVTQVQHPAPCGNPYYGGPTQPNGTGCTAWAEQVQVVDTSNGGAVVRGTLTLPDTPYGWNGWGWGGFWYYDWFGGSEIVQVGGDALAFRRWYPQYAQTGPDGYWTYIDSLDALFVIDLSNPDAPSVASTTITNDTTTWWGDMQAIGNTLYTTHWEWVERPDPKSPSGTRYTVRYYLDTVDLSDRSHPHIGQSVNVPGQLVGGSSTDPSILYTIDYRWDDGGDAWNDLDVVKVEGSRAYLQSQTVLDGWVGNVFVQGNVAYASVQEYDWMITQNGGTYEQPYMELHQIDLTNPASPIDQATTSRTDGWGWLLAVQGNVAVVTSGWGPMGFDIYTLNPSSPPTFQQSVRALGWGANSILRQDNTLYVSTGYWGVQTIPLQ